MRSRPTARNRAPPRAAAPAEQDRRRSRSPNGGGLLLPDAARRYPCPLVLSSDLTFVPYGFIPTLIRLRSTRELRRRTAGPKPPRMSQIASRSRCDRVD